MNIDEIIKSVDRDIIFQEQSIANLKQRKEKFVKLQEKFPGAHYHNGAICLSNIWDKVNCMRIERTYNWSRTEVQVKFLLGKKDSLDGIKIYTLPYQTKIADITYSHRKPKSETIKILNYENIIPDICPKKKAFQKRIKIYLVNYILRNKLTIDDSSFNKDEFVKLMLLR